MKKFWIKTLAMMTLAVTAYGQTELVEQVDHPVDYAKPLMGTDSDYSLSNGNVYPAIAMPWGMNFLDTPDRKDGRWLGIHVRCHQNQRV